MSRKRPQEDEDKKNEKKIANHWSMGLLSSMKDPELLIKEDDNVVTIKDKYPKVNKRNNKSCNKKFTTISIKHWI
jgi:hypothetical protein